MDSEKRIVYYSPEMIAILRMNTYMSPATWQKLITADPTGWRGFFQDETADKRSKE